MMQRSFHPLFSHRLLLCTAPPRPVTLAPSRPFQIVCAARRRKNRPNKWILHLVAANSDMFPPPLDLLISALCDGTASPAFGSRKLGLGFLVVCGVGLLLSGTGRGSQSALLWKAWWVSAIGFLVIKWRRQTKTCILGLCCFGVLVVLGMRKGDRQKWVQRVRNCSPVMDMVMATQCRGTSKRR